MPAPKNSSITLSRVGLTWPDGSAAFADIDGTFGTGRTGLVGANGSGKSTLLRIIAGSLAPTTGRVTTSGDVDYLPQALTLDVMATVADLLGITAKVEALRAIERGDVAERHFDTIGDDWDIGTRADEALRPVGLTSADLQRRVSGVSGGEAVLIAIAGLRLRRAPITLLDEPTNNLDRGARSRLADMVRSWPGTLVVVSHDTSVLDLMDDTAELHAGRLTVFGGPYREWRAQLEREQAAAAQAARTARQVVKIEKRQRIDAEAKIAQSARAGKKARANNVAPKIVLNQWASNAQASAGKLRTDLDEKLRSAQAALDAADSRVRDDEHIRIDLADPDVPKSRRIAELHGTNRSFVVQGPERIAIVGPNGVGKTTLLDALVQGGAPFPDRATGTLLTDRVGYLRQRLDGLDDTASVLSNVQAATPRLPSGRVRNQSPGSCSGGRRWIALWRPSRAGSASGSRSPV